MVSHRNTALYYNCRREEHNLLHSILQVNITYIITINFDTETNGTEIQWKRFWKIPKLLNLLRANFQLKIFRNFSWNIKINGTEIPDKKFPKIWVYCIMLSSFPDIGEKCCHKLNQSSLEISGNSIESTLKSYHNINLIHKRKINH